MSYSPMFLIKSTYAANVARLGDGDVVISNLQRSNQDVGEENAVAEEVG